MKVAKTPCTRCRKDHRRCDKQLPCCGACYIARAACVRADETGTAEGDRRGGRSPSDGSSDAPAATVGLGVGGPAAHIPLSTFSHALTPSSLSHALPTPPGPRAPTPQQLHQQHQQHLTNPDDLLQHDPALYGLDGALFEELGDHLFQDFAGWQTPTAGSDWGLQEHQPREEEQQQRQQQQQPSSHGASQGPVVQVQSQQPPEADAFEASLLELNTLGLAGSQPSTAVVAERQSRGLPSSSPAQMHYYAQPMGRPTKGLDQTEALLLRYYIDDISPWLDISLPGRYFAQEIPHRALTNPCLLNAIYSISARYLARRGNFDPNAYLGYLRTCITSYTHVIQGPPSQALAEEILAVHCILRLFEGLEVSLLDHFPDSPLAEAVDKATTAAIVASPLLADGDSNTSNNPLIQAILRSGLRQDIHTSFRKQEAIRSAPDSLLRISKSLSGPDGPTSDWDWADRMLAHCVDVLTFCFQHPTPSSSTPTTTLSSRHRQWQSLTHYSQQWWDRKPTTFNPIHYAPGHQHQPFPTIWLLYDCHVAAVQHYHLSALMLRAYEPGTPRLGPRRQACQAALERAVREHVRQLCGVAVSNPRVVPALLTACHGVALCGEAFAEGPEKEALMGLLRRCRVEWGWMTSTALRQLREVWGWREGEGEGDSGDVGDAGAGGMEEG